ncbi:hypothetical protein HAX54_004848, partial [Datura stramonium]|nr:hypothetical protein [Datura stramonium]
HIGECASFALLFVIVNPTLLQFNVFGGENWQEGSSEGSNSQKKLMIASAENAVL